MNYLNSLSYWTILALTSILAANAVYLIVFSVAGLFRRRQIFFISSAAKKLKTLVIYPVYKENEVILASVQNAICQDYPKDSYTIMVIADCLQERTIKEIQLLDASVCIMPASDKRNKAKAINYMLSGLTEEYDNCIIMDADNHVESNFLAQVTQYFIHGTQILQARRVAKNNSNNLSQLDSFSEIINNHIFRKGQRALGFSSSLIGSGMAFDFSLFKELMKDMNVFSGFDKELELRIMERGLKIEYAPEIVVYDEKVADNAVFVNQRRRWIYAQWFFLQKNFFKAIYMGAKGNFDYANKVFQFILLPRIICIGLGGLLLIASYFISPILFRVVVVTDLSIATALFIPVKDQVISARIPSILMSMFGAFGHMLIAMTTAGRAAGKFLHTPHNAK